MRIDNFRLFSERLKNNNNYYDFVLAVYSATVTCTKTAAYILYCYIIIIMRLNNARAHNLLVTSSLLRRSVADSV